MNSNESTDLKDNRDKELELEQVKLRQMELELELKQAEQEADLEASKPKPKPPTAIIAFLVILPPIGIIMLWLSKEPIIMKILGTLFGIFALSVIMGWLGANTEPWHMIFLFTGQ